MSDNAPMDRRVIRTKKALWAALLDLIKVRDWNDINVRAICDRADVARSSFYLHFRNKQELLDYGFSCGESEMVASFDSLAEGKALRSFLGWLVDHLAEGRAMYQNRDGQMNPSIFRRFKAVAGNVLTQQLRRQVPDLSREQSLFIAGGVFAVLEDWLCRGDQLGSEKVINLVDAEIERHIMQNLRLNKRLS